MTTNPSIFQAAVGDGAARRQQLGELAAHGATVGDVVRTVTTDVVRDVFGLFTGIFHAAGGVDGRCRSKSTPRLACDTDATIAQAMELAKIVVRPNVPIPATPPGRRPSPRRSPPGSPATSP